MQRRRHALIIGVEEYTNFSDTPFCHADVDLLAKTLTSDCDYDTAAVRCLKLARGDGVSPSDIIRHVESLTASADAQDTVLFYFAGHGTLESGTPYLVLPESTPGDWGGTAIALSDIANRLRHKDRVCFRILDACHSGVDVRGGLRGLDSSGFTREALEQGQGWATLAACAENEYSYTDPARMNGVFTYFLCEAIRKAKDGDLIYPEQIKLAVCEEMAHWCNNRGFRQRPTLNAAISGNVSIATRVAKAILPAVGVTPPGGYPPAKQGAQDFADRLAAARTAVRLSLDNNDELRSWVTAFREELIAASSKAAWVGGISPGIGEIEHANAMPHAVKEVVVPHIRGSKMKPRHEYETKVERENNPLKNLFGRFSGLNFLGEPEPPRIVSIKHTITECGFCDSYVGGEIHSDDVLPDAYIFGYLIPLQTSACLLAGCIVRPVGESEWQHVFLQEHHFKLNDDKSGLAAVAKACVKALRVRVQRETEKMVDYIEWETSQTAR